SNSGRRSSIRSLSRRRDRLTSSGSGAARFGLSDAHCEGVAATGSPELEVLEAEIRLRNAALAQERAHVPEQTLRAAESDLHVGRPDVADDLVESVRELRAGGAGGDRDEFRAAFAREPLEHGRARKLPAGREEVEESHAVEVGCLWIREPG